MSLLTEREWCTSYRRAAQYDRMTGYFSADALALAAPAYRKKTVERRRLEIRSQKCEHQ
jgi:hypothetical protein